MCIFPWDQQLSSPPKEQIITLPAALPIPQCPSMSPETWGLFCPICYPISESAPPGSLTMGPKHLFLAPKHILWRPGDCPTISTSADIYVLLQQAWGQAYAPATTTTVGTHHKRHLGYWGWLAQPITATTNINACCLGIHHHYCLCPHNASCTGVQIHTHQPDPPLLVSHLEALKLNPLIPVSVYAAQELEDRHSQPSTATTGARELAHLLSLSTAKPCHSLY